MRKNSRFTLDERKQMAKDYAAGMSLRQICAKYGLAVSSLQRILDREKVAMRDSGGNYSKAPTKGLLSWLNS